MIPSPFERIVSELGWGQPCRLLLGEVTVVLTLLLLTLATSGLLVGHATRTYSSRTEDEEPTQIRPPDPDTGRIVGKCENILVVLFVVADAITGLALIFTAKAFVRQKEFQLNPRYYLVGTMVNVTYSVVMGVTTKLILAWGTGQGSFLP